MAIGICSLKGCFYSHSDQFCFIKNLDFLKNIDVKRLSADLFSSLFLIWHLLQLSKKIKIIGYYTLNTKTK